MISIAALIGAVFGKGGGDEVRRAEFLSALRQRLGASRVGGSGTTSARCTTRGAGVAGGAVSLRTGSGTAAGQRDRGQRIERLRRRGQPARARGASNALLVSARRSANGHPLFVAGPQVGYFYPEILLEIDLHGGGIDARGAAVPGAAPYV